VEFAQAYGPHGRPLRVLDAGCGTGSLLEQWRARPEVEVIGIDLSPEALAYCRSRGAQRLIRADLTALPFPTATFDLVTALDVVEHVERDEAALAEICRVLKPGGTLVLSVPAYRFLWSSHDVALHHKRRYTARALRAIVARAGLVRARLTHLLAFLFLPIAAVRLFDRLARRPHQESAHLVPLPGALNRLLIGIQNAELALARRVDLPFGISLFCIAYKPKHG
jgi:SAM-dependent methyltransferase